MRVLAQAGEDRSAVPSTPQLSTDYLNRYAEALMLLEIAPMDPEIVADLQAWHAVGYREHFERSALRCRPSALAAYDGLAGDRRRAFERLCLSMNRLIASVTALLADHQANATQSRDVAVVVDVASEALRTLMAHATQFINANGLVDIGALERTIDQDEIDALFAH
jgi:hypothetical protein